MRALAVVMVLALTLAACGGGKNRPAADTTATSPSTAPAASTGTPPSAAPSATFAASPSLPSSTAEVLPSPTSAPARELACGTQITSSVTLANDLTCDPVGLVVAADGVVLDLGGHTITGPGAGTRHWPLPSFDIAGVVVRANNV